MPVEHSFNRSAGYFARPTAPAVALPRGAGLYIPPEEVIPDTTALDLFNGDGVYLETLSDIQLETLEYNNVGSCTTMTFRYDIALPWKPFLTGRVGRLRVGLDPDGTAWERLRTLAIVPTNGLYVWSGYYVNHSENGGGTSDFTYTFSDLTDLTENAWNRAGELYGSDGFDGYAPFWRYCFGTSRAVFTAEELAYAKENEAWDETVGQRVDRKFKEYPQAGWGHAADMWYLDAKWPAELRYVTLDFMARGIKGNFEGYAGEARATEWAYKKGAEWRVQSGRYSFPNKLAPNRFVKTEPNEETAEIAINSPPFRRPGDEPFEAREMYWSGGGYTNQFAPANPGGPGTGSKFTSILLPAAGGGYRYALSYKRLTLGAYVYQSAGVRGGLYEKTSEQGVGSVVGDSLPQVRPGAKYKVTSGTFRYEFNIKALKNTDAIVLAAFAYIADGEDDGGGEATPWEEYLDETGTFKGWSLSPRKDPAFKQMIGYFSRIAASKNEILVAEINLPKELLEEYHGDLWGPNYNLVVGFSAYVRSAVAANNDFEVRILNEEFREETLPARLPVPAEAQIAYLDEPTYGFDNLPGLLVPPARVIHADVAGNPLGQYAAACKASFGGGKLVTQLDTAKVRRNA